jgi:hypothetical protein
MNPGASRAHPFTGPSSLENLPLYSLTRSANLGLKMKEFLMIPNFSYIIVISGPSFHAQAP